MLSFACVLTSLHDGETRETHDHLQLQSAIRRLCRNVPAATL